MAFLSLFLPIFCAFTCLQALWPSSQIKSTTTLVKLFVSIGAGLGMSSVSYYIAINIFGTFTPWSIFFEAATMIIIIFFALWFWTKYQVSPESEAYVPEKKEEQKNLLASKNIRYLSTGFWLAVVSTISLFVVKILIRPQGGWDAWAIWNMRARFLYRSRHWADVFTLCHEPGCPHLDYPLLIPGSIARIWTYIHADPMIIPILIAFLFTFSTVGLLVSSLTFLKNNNTGYLAGIIVMSFSFFTDYGSRQFADVPLSFFVLSTVVMLYLKESIYGKENMFCFLAGLTAGMAAWTKNEGILFAVVVFCSHAIVTIWKKGFACFFRESAFFLMGLLPIVCVILHFKIAVNQPNDLVSSDRRIHILLDYLLDPDRYYIVFTGFIHYFQKFLSFVVIIPIIFILFRPSLDHRYLISSIMACIIIGLLLSGYFMIYIITPNDISWHLKTSLSRLYLQVMPSVVFVFFSCMKFAEPVHFFPQAQPKGNKS